LISPVNERMVEIFSMFTDQPLILTYGAHSTLLWFLYPFGASLFLGYKIGWWIERFPRKNCHQVEMMLKSNLIDPLYCKYAQPSSINVFRAEIYSLTIPSILMEEQGWKNI
jgi:hypothetical protein